VVSPWGVEIDAGEGLAVLADAVSTYQDALGGRLVAAYALGSLAHGGFSPLVSDVDLGVVLADPLLGSDSDTMERVAGGLKRRGTVLHERLSVFWGTRKTLRGEQVGGRFPPLDLLDLIQNGKLLAGRDARSDLPQPTPVDLFVAGAEFALGFLAGIDVTDAHPNQSLGSMRPADSDTVEQLRRPELLLAQGVRRVTKLVLFPVRFLFTAETGLVGTNESAVAHFLTATGAPSTDLVAAALAWRRDPPELSQAEDLLQQGMIPLYLYYIDDHVRRLTDLGRVDLTEAFTEWRRRILS